MLDSLSEKLRSSIHKIMKLVSVDKDVVEALVKDIERAMLSGDVDVKLVYKLSDNIRNRAFEKLPTGITRKDHIVTVVYEELTKVLGEKRPEITLKPKKILLVGLFGSGKCVHKDSLIPTSDGQIRRIEDIYEEYKIHGNEEQIDDGYVVGPHPSVAPKILSFNPDTLKIESREVSGLWKRKAKSLLKIKLDNGSNHEIIVTPEHPFFVLDNGQITTIRADNLSNGSFIAIPNSINVNTTKELFLYDMLTEDFVIIDRTLTNAVLHSLREKYGTLKKAHSVIKPKMGYCMMTHILKKGIIPLKIVKSASPDVLKNLSHSIRIKSYGLPKSGYRSQKSITLPYKMTPELSEWLGYLIGEGCIHKNTIGITNSDDIILARIINLTETLFGIRPSIITDKRNPSVRTVQINSKTLVRCAELIFDICSGKKSSIASIPQPVLSASDDILKPFIRAFFDGEGSVGKDSRYIEISSASEKIIRQLSMALLRFGIISAISSKKIKEKYYWRLFVRGRFAEKFALNIGCIHPEKSVRLQNAIEIGKHQTPGNKTELLNVGTMLKEVREQFGISIGELQRSVFSYGLLEATGMISRSSLKKFVHKLKNSKRRWPELLEDIEKGESLEEIRKKYTGGWANATIHRMSSIGWVESKSGQNILSIEGKLRLESSQKFDGSLLGWLSLVAESDISWCKVSLIENYTNDSEYVYDLTVDGFHNFIANGIIVHNTSTAAKLARFYKKKGLRPALVACDTVRPAAFEQLQQLSKSIDVPFFGEKGESDSSKVLKDAIKKIKADVVIVDSSGRDALDNSLIKEIQRLNEILKPDEKILVLPADIGQVAKQQAAAFQSGLGITDVIVTKMDATAKGGGALTACYETGAKVKFITIGETPDDLEVYDPPKFVARLIGMPDIETLLEKAKAVADEGLAKKIIKADFDLNDFYQQMSSVQQMGPLSNIADMLGLGSRIPKDALASQQEKIKKWGPILKSMTPAERANPDIIDMRRVQRIARGSGCSEHDVKELLNNYNKTKKIMKQLSPGKMRQGDMNKFMRGFRF
ncbi:MAG: signal recognition particle receptor subunit alpha [Candidatus Aenigmarchaeota archaeon]|nr:signal recognition particle receptor subunit alpha [Candidatus Aenigmarchaeota archaeon]